MEKLYPRCFKKCAVLNEDEVEKARAIYMLISDDHRKERPSINYKKLPTLDLGTFPKERANEYHAALGNGFVADEDAHWMLDHNDFRHGGKHIKPVAEGITGFTPAGAIDNIRRLDADASSDIGLDYTVDYDQRGGTANQKKNLLAFTQSEEGPAQTLFYIPSATQFYLNDMYPVSYNRMSEKKRSIPLPGVNYTAETKHKR